VAERAGCPHAVLVQRATDIPWETLEGVATIGLTAGASAPQILVDEMITALRQRFQVEVEIVTTATETIAFNVPRELRG
jgi:4-hydroxy-3-methylbut-2-en-1-yl diphosphate reductase